MIFRFLPFKWGGAPEGRRGQRIHVKVVISDIFSPKYYALLSACADTPEAFGRTRLTPNASSGAVYAVANSQASSSGGNIGSASTSATSRALEALVVVELDGSQHAEKLDYDPRRRTRHDLCGGQSGF